MKIDMHIHTHFSDGAMSPRDVVKTAKKAGMDGVAICDHNTNRGYKAIKSYLGKKKDLLVIPGTEVSTTKGHILGIGIKEPVPKKILPADAVDHIKDQGAIVIIPHPQKSPSGIPYKVVEPLEFDAVETINGRSPESYNRKADQFATRLKKAKVGGSDAHSKGQLGRAFTVFKINTSDPEDIYEEILKKRSRAKGHGFSLGGYLSDNANIFLRFASRGFKRV